jgi:hypothetical protein
VKLMMLPRLCRPGDGDYGICFEYAVHDAMRRGDAVSWRGSKRHLGSAIPGGDIGSILFGAEKTGSQQLIETAHDALTSLSVLMYGQRGRPAELKRLLPPSRRRSDGRKRG